MEHTVDDNGNTGTNDADDQVPLFDLISSFLGPPSPSPSQTPTPTPTELEDDQHDTYDTYDRIDDRIDDDGANEFMKSMEIDESININKDVPVSPLVHLDVDPCKVIIFSKDRPWQLQQLLHSMCLQQQQQRQQQHQHQQKKFYQSKQLNIFIICKVTKRYKSGYDKVKCDFDGDSDGDGDDEHDDDEGKCECECDDNGPSEVRIRWLYENECDGTESDNSSARDDSFANLLEKTLRHPIQTSELEHNITHTQQQHTNTNTNTNTRKSRGLVMFLTDDCVLLEPIHDILQAAESVLIHNDQTSKRTLAFLTRLHAGVTYSQTRDEASPPPYQHLSYHETGTGSELKALLYPHKYGSGEYSYPFDLSGGIYHYDTCIRILDEIQRFDLSKDVDVNANVNVNANANANANVDSRGGAVASINTCARTCGYAHPNTFEINGNNSIQRIQNESKSKSTSTSTSKLKSHHTYGGTSMKQKTFLAIPSQPALLILAINRVQDIYKAPIATATATVTAADQGMGDGGDGKVTYSPELLTTFLDHERFLDIPKYKATTFNSSHIGDVFLQAAAVEMDLEPLAARRTIELSQSFTLSVLMPVHTGPPSHAVVAMQSILHQTIRDSDILPIQIVLVDDRCTDGSIDEMRNTAQSFAKEHDQVLEIRDHRQTGNITERRCRTSIAIAIDIVQCPSPGVGAALNCGLHKCEAELVARMDADDISCPRRFIAQLRHMRANPKVKALGTSCVIFSGSSSSSPSSIPFQTNKVMLPFTRSCNETHTLIRTSVEPTDAGFVSWSLLFSSVMVHPSVMFRKEDIIGNRSYSETDANHFTEDYDLWLRLSENNSGSVCSLPMIGVFHRKHLYRSRNDAKRIRQREESIELSRRQMMKYCNVPVSLEVAGALKYPHDADFSLLDEAAGLLCTLEASFIKRVTPHLTKNEVDLVALDCNARLGELATLSVEKYGRSAAETGEAWRLWCMRCPGLQVERMALLLQTNNVSLR